MNECISRLVVASAQHSIGRTFYGGRVQNKTAFLGTLESGIDVAPQIIVASGKFYKKKTVAP